MSESLDKAFIRFYSKAVSLLAERILPVSDKRAMYLERMLKSIYENKLFNVSDIKQLVSNPAFVEAVSRYTDDYMKRDFFKDKLGFYVQAVNFGLYSKEGFNIVADKARRNKIDISTLDSVPALRKYIQEFQFENSSPLGSNDISDLSFRTLGGEVLNRILSTDKNMKLCLYEVIFNDIWPIISKLAEKPHSFALPIDKSSALQLPSSDKQFHYITRNELVDALTKYFAAPLGAEIRSDSKSHRTIEELVSDYNILSEELSRAQADSSELTFSSFAVLIAFNLGSLNEIYSHIDQLNMNYLNMKLVLNNSKPKANVTNISPVVWVDNSPVSEHLPMLRELSPNVYSKDVYFITANKGDKLLVNAYKTVEKHKKTITIQKSSIKGMNGEVLDEIIPDSSTIAQNEVFNRLGLPKNRFFVSVESGLRLK